MAVSPSGVSDKRVIFSINGGSTWLLAGITPNINIALSSVVFGMDYWVAVANDCISCFSPIRVIRCADKPVDQ